MGVEAADDQLERASGRVERNNPAIAGGAGREVCEWQQLLGQRDDLGDLVGRAVFQ
jgi:hypothetical protein